ncbi:hypothetical protein HGRIS_011760 [Hohenbuehelia grisea]|uniref:NmrA-like domain-containing protein n=1 Tax=Hohenbuehelia grisea TaxID=104357 RepID=A0ABR3JYB3_9AGAR
MTPYKSFAVAGAGKIGTFVIEALLAQNAHVVVLTRGVTPKTFPTGAAAEVVDYASRASIAAALTKHGVEVFVSTMGHGGFEAQAFIAVAAKEAGVRLFVPSEFGMSTVGVTEGVLAVKDAFAGHLKSIGLPSARFFVSPAFMKKEQTGYFGGEAKWLTGYDVNGKVNIVGSGTKPISFTAEEDIGGNGNTSLFCTIRPTLKRPYSGFLAYVLTSLEPSELHDKRFRLQGDRKTFLQLAELFKAETVFVDTMPGPSSEYTTILHKFIERGMGSTGWDYAAGKEGEEAAGSTNQLWPGHQWKSIKEIHGL